MKKLCLSPRGFTLIELLIVIAIILILVAIALPNFLEAQIRARVARAESDMRAIGIAMESYYLDFGIYPNDHEPDSANDRGLFQLTSPISYIETLPEDPFSTNSGILDPNTQEIGWEMASTAEELRRQVFFRTEHNTNVHAWALASQGPDIATGESYGSAGGDNFICNAEWPFCGRTTVCSPDPFVGLGWMTYSPTNGTKSKGDIMLPGGEHRTGRYCIDAWNLIVGRYPNRPGLN